MNPVQTGPGMGASERAHANLHSAPRTKSFGGHEAPDACSAQSTGVLTVSLCHTAGPHPAPAAAVPHQHCTKDSPNVAADPESCHSRGMTKSPP